MLYRTVVLLGSNFDELSTSFRQKNNSFHRNTLKNRGCKNSINSRAEDTIVNSIWYLLEAWWTDAYELRIVMCVKEQK